MEKERTRNLMLYKFKCERLAKICRIEKVAKKSLLFVDDFWQNLGIGQDVLKTSIVWDDRLDDH